MSFRTDSVGAAPASLAGSDQPPDMRILWEAGLERPIRPAGLELAAEGDDFRIIVVGADGAEFLALGPFHEDEVLAAWRALAEAAKLPRMVRGADGALVSTEPPFPGLRAGRVNDRGRLVLLTGRRPRFLVRRKVGRPARRPLVYREPELAAGTR